MFTVWIQSQNQDEAVVVGKPVDEYDDALTEVNNLLDDYDVVERETIDPSEAASFMDIDGRFVAAWRTRVEDADEYDITAIVEA